MGSQKVRYNLVTKWQQQQNIVVKTEENIFRGEWGGEWQLSGRIRAQNPQEHSLQMVTSGVLKNIFALFPQFQAQNSPKTVEISWIIGVSFVINKEPLLNALEFRLMKWLKAEPLDSLRIGLATRKSQWSEDWNFQVHPPNSGKGKGEWVAN